jgi:hypothetical protein
MMVAPALAWRGAWWSPFVSCRTATAGAVKALPLCALGEGAAPAHVAPLSWRPCGAHTPHALARCPRSFAPTPRASWERRLFCTSRARPLRLDQVHSTSLLLQGPGTTASSRLTGSPCRAASAAGALCQVQVATWRRGKVAVRERMRRQARRCCLWWSCRVLVAVRFQPPKNGPRFGALQAAAHAGRGGTTMETGRREGWRQRDTGRGARHPPLRPPGQPPAAAATKQQRRQGRRVEAHQGRV